MSNFFKTIGNTVKYWYIPLIIGILFILLGIYVFMTPIESYITLAVFFSVAFAASGLLDIFFSVQNRKELDGWGWALAVGILNLLMGIYLMAHPDLTMLILPFVVGFTLLFRSFQGLGFAFELRSLGVLNWGNVAIAGALGIILSSLLIFNPLIAGLSIVAMTALTFVLVGILNIVISLRLKKLKDYPSKISTELKDSIQKLKQEYFSQVKK